MTSAAAGSSIDPEKERDRLSAWKIALISAMAALLGALVGGVFTYLTAIHSTDSQAAQDRDDFVRTQRQTAYSRFIVDFVQSSLDMQGYVTALYAKSGGASVAYAKFQKSIVVTGEDVVSVSIIGSDKAAKAAVQLLQTENKYFGAILKVFQGYKDGVRPTDEQTTAYDNIKPPTLTLDTFRSAARHDLGAS